MNVVEQAFVFSQEIAAETRIADVLDVVVDRTRKLLHTAEVRLCVGPGSAGAVELSIELPVPGSTKNPRWIIAENRTSILPAEEDCARCGYARSNSQMQFLLAPVQTGVSEYGGLCVFRDRMEPFSADEIKAFELLACSAAAAISGVIAINHAGRHTAAELHHLLARSLSQVQDQIEAVRRRASLDDDQLMVELIRLRAGLKRAHSQVEAIYSQNRHALENGPDLTRREQEVLELLAGCATNREVSDRLAISIHTTKSHVRSILYKLNAVNRRQAVAQAHRMGLIRVLDSD